MRLFIGAVAGSFLTASVIFANADQLYSWYWYAIKYPRNALIMGMGTPCNTDTECMYECPINEPDCDGGPQR